MPSLGFLQKWTAKARIQGVGGGADDGDGQKASATVLVGEIPK